MWLIAVLCVLADASVFTDNQITFSTDFEDLFVSRYIFPEKKVGTYIDIGANHAIFHSNTKLFHWKGWNGVVVDPTLAHYSTHATDRVGDIRLHVASSTLTGAKITLFDAGQLASVEKAAGSKAVEDVCPLLPSPPTYPLPTTHYPLPTTHYPLPTTHYPLPTTHYPLPTTHYPLPTTSQVYTANLSTICALLNNKVDLFSLDVERHELSVLSGNDFNVCAPTVIIIELSERKAEIAALLAGANYVNIMKEGKHGNSVYIQRDFLAANPLPESISHGIPTEEGKHLPNGVVTMVEVLRAAVNLGLVREFNDEKQDKDLKGCWWDHHKLPNHQKHLKPHCFTSLFGARYLRPGDKVHYTCFSKVRNIYFGFGDNENCEILMHNCIGVPMGDKVEILKVHGWDSTVYRFGDSGSITLFNYTNQKTVMRYVSDQIGMTGSVQVQAVQSAQTVQSMQSGRASDSGDVHPFLSQAHPDFSMSLCIFVFGMAVGLMVGMVGARARTFSMCSNDKKKSPHCH